MTVSDAVAAVAPAGPKEKHGSYVDADEEYHRRKAIAAVPAAAAACHRRETSVAAAVAAAACHRRETSVSAAAAAYYRREVPYRRLFVGLRLPRPPRPENQGRRQEHAGSGVPPAHSPPVLVSQFRGPCVGSRRNGWWFLVSSG